MPVRRWVPFMFVGDMAVRMEVEKVLRRRTSLKAAWRRGQLLKRCSRSRVPVLKAGWISARRRGGKREDVGEEPEGEFEGVGACSVVFLESVDRGIRI